MVAIGASAFEWVRAISPVVAALLAVLGAAVVTIRVSDQYEQRRKQREFDQETMRKQREFDQETMRELASLYGQIFAIWKEWDTLCRFRELEPPPGAAWSLLGEAADAEGRLEALLIRIAADRPLHDPDDIRTLAGLRQSFKVVRKAIRENEPLEWRSAIDRQYAALKAYAASTAALVAAERAGPTPTAATARAVFQKITSDEYEPTWADLAEDAGWTANSHATEP
jgi:hypothetical protein